jgi:hypothetical protein
VVNVSDQWITQSDQLLQSLRALQSQTDKDRLEIIKAMFFILNTLERSLKGWRSWVQNLDFMARFSADELRELEDGLNVSAQAFVQYDVDVTKKYQSKIPTVKFKVRKGRAKVDTRGLFA